MFKLINQYLNHLRVLSDLNSEAHREFIHQKLEDHRQYMAGFKPRSPYLHPDY